MKWMSIITILCLTLSACGTKQSASGSHSSRERKAMRLHSVDAPPPVLITPESVQQ